MKVVHELAQSRRLLMRTIGFPARLHWQLSPDVGLGAPFLRSAFRAIERELAVDVIHQPACRTRS